MHTPRAVYVIDMFDEVFGTEVIVTYVRPDETDSDAILRAIELYGDEDEYYVK